MQIKARADFAVHVRELYDGAIDFTDFAKRTRETWAFLAKAIARRWSLPCWMGVEDVQQDLLIGFYARIWKYDPDYLRSDGTPAPIDRFAVYSAFDYAKKRAHKARGANLHGDADSNPSRFELAKGIDLAVRLGATDRENDRAWHEQPSAPATQHDELEARERADKVCADDLERYVIDVLFREGSYEGAAWKIWNERDESNTKPKDVAELVVRTAVAVAHRLQTAA
ncbi:MAG: hypothetical protein PVSMB8_03760 [Vulcanimicrobiaceae bacterium]